MHLVIYGQARMTITYIRRVIDEPLVMLQYHTIQSFSKAGVQTHLDEDGEGIRNRAEVVWDSINLKMGTMIKFCNQYYPESNVKSLTNSFLN